MAPTPPNDSLFDVDPDDVAAKAGQPNGHDVKLCFEIWRLNAAKKHTTALSDKRKTLIVHALRQYDLETIADALVGWRYSPHHRGENATRTVYNQLELILRDCDKIEQFAAYTVAARDNGSAPLAAVVIEAARRHQSLHPLSKPGMAGVGRFERTGRWQPQ